MPPSSLSLLPPEEAHGGGLLHPQGHIWRVTAERRLRYWRESGSAASDRADGLTDGIGHLDSCTQAACDQEQFVKSQVIDF
jgi:hypothetical protein